MYKKNVSELGRSMVEMLGVLAIIGVLSVAGIAGYRYAMDRYIANDVLYESNIRGFDVTANFKGRRLPDLAEIGGYAKYTGTGKPIAVYPNPSDFSWSEYADKCPSEELCQAFDVEVKGLNKRQCQMIMQSSWELPDAYLVSTGTTGGDTSGEETAPIASVLSSRPIMRTASNADSGLCDDFGEEEQNIAIRFRFVSTFTDFTDEDYETGWEDETTSDNEDSTGGGSNTGGGSGTGTGGTTDSGGTTTPEDGGTGTPSETPTDSDKNDNPEPIVCSEGKEDNGSGICVCPSGTTEYNNECKANCTGNFAFDSEGNCTKCISNYYGDNCTSYCTATWNNGTCECTGEAYWDGTSCVSCGTNQQVNSSKTECECKSNWHGEECTTYCDINVALMSGGTCVCEDTTTYWNGQSCVSCGANKAWNGNACVCDNQSYADGDNCIQCPSGSTPTSDGCSCSGTNTHWNGSSCITCDTNATFTDNECVCNNGYSGDGQTCAVCESPRQTTAGNTACECPTGTIWTGEETNRCEEDDDGSGGVTNLCEAGWVWDSEIGDCVENSCSSTDGCPYGYVCDITDGQCIKDWECSNPNALDVTKEECLECENRFWSNDGKCAVCPEGYIVQGDECVEDISAFCTTAMTTAGFSTSNFEIDSDDKTIKYTGDMTVVNDLDISKCNLTLNGTLTVNSGTTLKAKSISATSSSANGINNAGTITVTQTIYGKGYTTGIDNKSTGIINANKIDGGQTKSDNAEIFQNYLSAIVNYGTINSNIVMCSRDVGTNKNSINIGVKNYGKIFADDILGAGHFSQEATVKASTQANNIDVYSCTNLADSILVINDALRTDSLLNAGTITVKKVQIKRAYLYNGSVDAEIFSVIEILNNYSTLSANLVYGGDAIIQKYTSGILTFGPGKITSPKIYYCDSYSSGSYSTTPIKKCAETCSAETPIWNGESCEACPAIRPTFNAEYGICE